MAEMKPGLVQAPTDGHLQKIEDGIRAEIPAEDQDDLDKIVMSGMQLLYSPHTRKSVLESLRDVDSDSDPQKVAIGIAGLLTIINKEAGAIPVDLYVPAGALLVVELLRFMSESGMAEEDPVLTGNVIEEFLAIVMQKMGYAVEDFIGPENQSQTEQVSAAPPQPAAAQPAPPMGRGLVGV